MYCDLWTSAMARCWLDLTASLPMPFFLFDLVTHHSILISQPDVMRLPGLLVESWTLHCDTCCGAFCHYSMYVWSCSYAQPSSSTLPWLPDLPSASFTAFLTSVRLYLAPAQTHHQI